MEHHKVDDFGQYETMLLLDKNVVKINLSEFPWKQLRFFQPIEEYAVHQQKERKLEAKTKRSNKFSGRTSLQPLKLKDIH